jgi:hypothetical protein
MAGAFFRGRRSDLGAFAASMKMPARQGWQTNAGLLLNSAKTAAITPQAIEFYESWDAELEKFVEGNYLLCRPDSVERFPRIAWWNKN